MQHQENGDCLDRLSRLLGVSKRSLKRWLKEKPRLLAPIAGFDMPGFIAYSEELRSKAAALEHKAKRSYGSGKLHEDMKGKLPRRVIQNGVTVQRKEENKVKRDSWKLVRWGEAMTCWAMDDTHCYTAEDGTKYWAHNIKDLATQYLLPPLTGKLAGGKEVADNLRALFERFGAPLFFKRDNGPNLCAKEVDELFSEYGVIALYSLAYYSPYNGSIEQSNCRLKKQIGALSQQYGLPVNEQTLGVLAELAALQENTKLKRSLGRRTAATHFLDNGIAHKKSERKEILKEIREIEKQLRNELGQEPKAYDIKRSSRLAIEAVLEKRQFVSILKPEPVSPIS